MKVRVRMRDWMFARVQLLREGEGATHFFDVDDGVLPPAAFTSPSTLNAKSCGGDKMVLTDKQRVRVCACVNVSIRESTCNSFIADVCVV
jgi:hypothetical protein